MAIVHLLLTVKVCPATTGLFSWFEKTVDIHLYSPWSDSCRLGRRNTASAELRPVTEATSWLAGSNSTTSTVAARLSGTTTSQLAVNGWPRVGGSVIEILRSLRKINVKSKSDTVQQGGKNNLKLTSNKHIVLNGGWACDCVKACVVASLTRR